MSARLLSVMRFVAYHAQTRLGGTTALACRKINRNTTLIHSIGHARDIRLAATWNKQYITTFVQIYLDVLAQPQVGQLEMRCGSIRQMHQQHAIDGFTVLIEHYDIREVSVACVLAYLLERKPLKAMPTVSGFLRLKQTAAVVLYQQAPMKYPCSLDCR